MCIGIPMQIVEADEHNALCLGPDAAKHIIDMRLLRKQPPGAWVLVFRHAAREVIDAERAVQIQNALLALDQAMQGDVNLDDFFPDLVGREPQLPDFLKP